MTIVDVEIKVIVGQDRAVGVHITLGKKSNWKRKCRKLIKWGNIYVEIVYKVLPGSKEKANVSPNISDCC